MADSSAPTAVAIRQLVATRVAAGQSDARKSTPSSSVATAPASSCVHRCRGSPPRCGSCRWWRWRWPVRAWLSCSGVGGAPRRLPWGPMTGSWSPGGRRAGGWRPAGAIRSGTLAVNPPELDDERSFLLRSLEDLEREHDAGDLSERDYAVLRDRYTARAAAVLRSLEAPVTATVTPSDTASDTAPRPGTAGADACRRRPGARPPEMAPWPARGRHRRPGGGGRDGGARSHRTTPARSDRQRLGQAERRRAAATNPRPGRGRRGPGERGTGPPPLPVGAGERPDAGRSAD